MIKIKIGGKALEVKPKTSIIEVADKVGIDIPRFCYHKKLSVAANCRMCLVEVKNFAKPLPACATQVMEGMEISTKSKFTNPKRSMFKYGYLFKQANALETVAFSRYPRLKKIKSFLENLNQPLFVRMTGSGSVIVAYYQSKKDCELAKVQFKRKFENYWCNTSKTL